ncbi:MAG: hypothetical protein CMJ41_04650 [Phycisphaerae bacterium]|nr:hypothetical protein [Phycisphaerae bacterium]HBZ97310.1 hypothetical protein [Phycisphaerales bacterium]|tara:strand:- start:874 stop:1536 length:663 start_codon:yes stop_codon:yes gene_type:complete
MATRRTKEMNGSDPEYLKPYLDAVASSGAGFDATLWSSREGQQRRFHMLATLAGLEGDEPGVIVDLGCGVGDLARYLVDCHLPFSGYLGLDAVPEMVEVAAEFDDSRCGFMVADPVRDEDVLHSVSADWVFISGTLNSMDESTARALVGRSFAAARRGIVFNFLSNRPHAEWEGRDLSPASRFDTVGWLDWAMSCTSLVSFDQHYYRGHDATIAMRHDGR